ncbi:MAG: Fe-S protein assembly co-chaperone HscB [Bacteroidia bacterium]
MQNYFDFYGLPVKFNLDEKELKARYFNLLKANHPDFFVNNPEKYKESLNNSSLNNEAYKCLSNFNNRANHILSLSGLNLEDKLPSSFLMEMMDINEALDDLKSERDAEKLKVLETEILNIKTGLGLELKALTEKADAILSEGEKPFKAIYENLLKHKYILRLNETLANIAAP